MFQVKNSQGVLYIVATPIGNFKDITLRALEILKNVDLVACEDTRITGKLLFHYQIKKPLISFHQHSKLSRIAEIINKLKKGKSVAVVTDSGTPGISDPGSVLVRRAISDKIKIVPIPGPSALTAAISGAGTCSKGIIFLGFLPKKKGRKKKFKEIRNFLKWGLTIIFYESPYRIKKTLQETITLSDKAEITVFREISKKFEETIYINKNNKAEQIEDIKTKGEFVVVVSPEF